MRLKKMVLILAALAMVVVLLAACASLGQSSGGGAGGGGQDDKEKPPVEEAQKEGAPKKMPEKAKEQQIAPVQGAEQESANTENLVEPPKDETLKLTIPKMDQIKNDEIPTGLGTNDQLFHDYAAVHLKRSGFPWQKVANVYIAGHRLGYVGTPSFLAFWDLNKVDVGDKVFVTDSMGRRYVYRVFKNFVVDPKDVFVTRPLRGKNILTLQTCTLPDYSRRLIVQAERVS
jgi:sortase A